MAAYLITRKYKEAKEDLSEETARIISATAISRKQKFVRESTLTKYFLLLMTC